MNIEEKLALSQGFEAVRFFRSGLFVNVYLTSLYIVIEHLKLDLQIVPIRFKKLGNQQLLRAGMPCEQLEKRIPNLIKTNYGYQLNGCWDISGYQAWYAKHNNETPLPPAAAFLSSEEIAFLQKWQWGKNPASVDAGFIYGLQQKIARDTKSPAD